MLLVFFFLFFIHQDVILVLCRPSLHCVPGAFTWYVERFVCLMQSED